MTYRFLKYETADRIARITIDRPERLNALHPPANEELLQAFTAFRDDPDMLVAILTGAGDRAFSAGNDLKYTAEHGRSRRWHGRAPFGGITSDFTCWKPIIAAVNGYAMGGGLELALACDIIVAADHAQLALPEVTVGLIAGAGGVHRLPRMIPPKIAMGMMLTGRRLTADEAHRFGLVNEVVPLADLIGDGRGVGPRHHQGRPPFGAGHQADRHDQPRLAAGRRFQAHVQRTPASDGVGRLGRGTASLLREAEAQLDRRLTPRGRPPATT